MLPSYRALNASPPKMLHGAAGGGGSGGLGCEPRKPPAVSLSRHGIDPQMVGGSQHLLIRPGTKLRGPAVGHGPNTPLQGSSREQSCEPRDGLGTTLGPLAMGSGLILLLLPTGATNR